jgi:hypothetical protein
MFALRHRARSRAKRSAKAKRYADSFCQAEGSISPGQLPPIVCLLKFKQKIAVLIGYHK